ncbi:MAG: metal-dependent hydrolase [Bdellovibrionales bacterium]|nr:metal-dependent hydrolase [Bdellovibrionales bacterium]
MDPLSQGVVGATLPQGILRNNPYLRIGFIVSFLAGMAPDLDVLIRSSQDPLLFLEFHRQFTHSLFFIPFGAFICALFFHLLWRKQIPFAWNYLYCFLGYGTHGLLDGCTTYGTQLLWPFSNARIAWNNISIVDPFFTLPLLGLIFLTYKKKNPKFGRVALVYGLCYLALGVLQRERAEAVAWQKVKERGHKAIRLEAKPSFANLLLWRVVYETEDSFYVDAVHVLARPYFFPGASVLKLNVKRDFSNLAQGQLTQDIERFRWFSNDYLAKSPTQENYIIDIRYAIVPNEIGGMFGIEISPNHPDQHVKFQPKRELNSGTRQKFFKMLFSPDAYLKKYKVNEQP